MQVEVSCAARVPAPSGRQGDSPPYFVTPALGFIMGSGTAPSGIKASAFLFLSRFCDSTLNVASPHLHASPFL